MAIRETIAEPDTVRLRYREALISVVAEIVRTLQAPSQKGVRILATGLVPVETLDRVVELAIADLSDLHEGNVTRYRLRLSEYRAWQPMQATNHP